MQRTQDINIRDTKRLIAPQQLKSESPISESAADTVFNAREAVKNILNGDDERLIVVVGPCSIHDPKAGLEYAKKLKELADRVLTEQRNSQCNASYKAFQPPGFL